MAQNKKRTTKKTSQKSKKKKSKIYIPVNKILLLCSIIIVFCSVLLFVNTTLESNARQKPVSVSKTKVIESKKNTQNNTQNKNSTKKSNNINKKQEVQKVDNSLPKKQEQNNTKVSTVKQTEKPIEKIEEKKQELKKIENKEAKSKYDYLPNAIGSPSLSFVFDDGGQNLNDLQKFIELPFDLTVAVLPKLQFSKESALRVRNAKKELILHQPMQAINLNVNPGPGAITPEMNLHQVELLLKENINELGVISGINNHEGSLICEDEPKMTMILQTLSNSGLYFLDSRTTSQTRVPQAAMALGLSYYERNVFLDNTQNISDMLKEIEKGLNIANKKGFVVMIGHVWSSKTLSPLLKELYPVLIKKGYKFTTVSNSGGLITP